MKNSGGDSDDKYISSLENYCEQLQEYDSDSSRFRYPVNKQMQFYFFENKWFDLLNVGRFFEALNNAINGIAMCIADRNEIMAEIEVEYRSEMLSEMDY